MFDSSDPTLSLPVWHHLLRVYPHIPDYGVFAALDAGRICRGRAPYSESELLATQVGGFHLRICSELVDRSMQNHAT